jgi:hypothetical protein
MVSIFSDEGSLREWSVRGMDPERGVLKEEDGEVKVVEEEGVGELI